MITLDVPPVRGLLTDLYARAEASDAEIGPRVAAAKAKAGGHLDDETLSQLIADAYTSIAPEVGRLIYLLVRARRPALVVEFGTSFGISAIHIAAALRDNGAGRLITTELNETKAAAAAQHIREAGLSDLVDIRTGDAFATLAGVSGIELLFLDGGKSLYLPLLRQLEPALAAGSLVVADDTVSLREHLTPYLDYVRDPANGYVSSEIPLDDGLEISYR
jgi:predicted O-methyltransferase YrrM